jgi:ubiquinone/menaquinone biosynthesis C-methylase UbiE
MDQEKIWDHFQNEGVQSFEQSRGRQEYLVRRLSAGSRVLNIGVGDGSLEFLAARKRVDVWSLDPSERAVENLRSRIPRPETAQVGYAQKMPFPDAHFDCVVMSEVLEHLDDETLLATLAEVHRVLRADGRFIGTVPARENLAASTVVCPCCGVQFHRWGHQRSFSTDTLTDTLRLQFQPEAVYEHFFIDWESANWLRKIQGLIKQALSWRGIGTYGTNRNIYFCVRKKSI